MAMKFTSVLAACALGALAACGTGDTSSLGGTVLGNLTGGLIQKRSTQAAPPITRAALAGVNGPVLLVEVPSRGSRGTLVLAQLNAGVATYVSADNLSLMIRNNALIVGSRGFGPDLMAADITGLAPALVRGSGRYARTMQFLNGEDRITTDRFDCTVTSQGVDPITVLGRPHRTRKMVEVCTTAAGNFTNTYWVEDNEVWQSRQWISRDVGSVLLQKVK